MILEEVRRLIRDIKTESDCNNGVVDFDGLFNVPFLNILRVFVGGEALEGSDPKSKQLIDAVSQISLFNLSCIAALPIPSFLARWFPNVVTKIIGRQLELVQLLHQLIQVSHLFFFLIFH